MTPRSFTRLLRLALFPLIVIGLSPAHAEEGKGAASAPPELPQNSGVASRERLSLKLEASRNRIYLGEAAQVTVTLHAAGAPVRNVGYPKLGGSGFGVESFTMPIEESDSLNGEPRVSYRFTTTITPRRSGTLTAGPAQLECEQVLPASGAGAFFGGTESSRVVLRSQPVTIEVLPLPEAGRPAAFGGAVGRFTLQRTASPAQVLVGDPVTVRTVVRGSGTLGRSQCESIAGLALRAYPPVAVRGVNGLSCEQVVVPESPLVRELPPATIYFFDPSSGRYRLAKSPAVALRVAPHPEAPRPPAEHPPQPTALPAAARPGSEFLSRWTWSAAPLCLMAAIAAASFYRRRKPATAAPALPSAPTPAGTPAQRGGATASLPCPEVNGENATLDIDGLYTALFRSLQSCLARPLNIPAGSITSPLPGGLLPPEVLLDAEKLLRRCHEVRYGKLRPDESEVTRDLQALQVIISFCSTCQSPPAA